jgi:N-acetylneuraminic acid mutarotase/fibronectin type 3 domain-containing protein
MNLKLLGLLGVSIAIACGRAVPSPPNLRDITVDALKRPVLAWDAVPGASSYTIYRSDAAGAENASLAVGTTKDTSLVDATGVVPDKTYYYMVAARGDGGYSRPSNEKQVHIPPGTVNSCTAVPPAPTENVPTVAGTTVTLSWTAVTSPPNCTTTYTVLRGPTHNGPYPTTVASNLTSTSTSDTGLAPGTYYYVVTANDPFGVSGTSNEQSATVVASCAAAPPAPTQNPVAIAGTTVSLSWTAVTSPPNCTTTYTVLRGPTNNGPYPTTVASNLTSTSTSDTGLAPGTYYYVVTAKDAFGASGTSNQQSATVVAPAGFGISGTVSGATASGATIWLTGAGLASASTDTSGNYAFTGLANGSYSLTASKSGYTFLPASIAVTVSGANATGNNFTTATCATAPSLTVPNMPVGRTSLVAASGPDGRIYVISGNGSTAITAEVDAYNPCTNAWATVASIPTPRQNAAAAVGPDGRIYVIGGDTIATVEAYDVTKNQWAAVAPMLTARGSLGAATGSDGRIYAVGGNPGSSQTNVVEAYDVNKNQWSTVSPMGTARLSLVVAADAKGIVYAIGGGTWGCSVYPSVEAYDPSKNQWTARSSLPSAVYSHTVAVGPDGRIYSFGGEVGAGCQYGSQGNTFIYDPVLDSWPPSPAPAAMPNPVRAAASAAGKGGLLYVFGGTFNGPTVATAQAYDPVQNIW